MVTVAEELDKAVQGAFTRPVPKVRRGADAVPGQAAPAQHPARRRTARYQSAHRRAVREEPDQNPRPELADRLEREVRARWQPQIRARAKQAAATTNGIMIDVQARFGYTAAPGSTDQARVRHLTLALPPRHAARLLEAQEAGLGRG
ncbi:telomere-protecting terminal protein Tpg [Streptomyces rhizosphaericus]|uniref:telomere-protecting terminal protein Tpg n=1 Tax=Streptomyces rhizosphaericus TaxID=114699 RepID=UPI003FD7B752